MPVIKSQLGSIAEQGNRFKWLNKGTTQMCSCSPEKEEPTCLQEIPGPTLGHINQKPQQVLKFGILGGKGKKPCFNFLKLPELAKGSH